MSVFAAASAVPKSPPSMKMLLPRAAAAALSDQIKIRSSHALGQRGALYPRGPDQRHPVGDHQIRLGDQRPETQVIQAATQVVEVRRDDGSTPAEVDLIENVGGDLMLGDGVQIDTAQVDQGKRLSWRWGCRHRGINQRRPARTKQRSRLDQIGLNISVPQVHSTLSPTEQPNTLTPARSRDGLSDTFQRRHPAKVERVVSY